MTDISEMAKGLRAFNEELLNSEPYTCEQRAKAAADALEAQAKRIAGLEYEARLFDEALGNAHARKAELEAALKNWDALISHQYTGSREAMSDMHTCAQETAKLLYGPGPWPNVPARAAMNGEKV